MASSTATPPPAEAKGLTTRLETLYRRRTVVEDLIRNMEVYQTLQRRPMGRAVAALRGVSSLAS